MPVKLFKANSPGRRDMEWAIRSKRSPARNRSEVLFMVCASAAVVTFAARLPCGTRAADTSDSIVRSTSSVTKANIPACVSTIEYDPTARRVSSCWYTPMARSATFLPHWASRSAIRVISGTKAEIRPGNSMPLKNIPLGNDHP